MAYIGRQLARGENKLFDDISSSFNGSTTTFNLTVSSVATATATAYQLFVSLGGVMQKPNTDFTTAGNQITFTTAPAAGLSCWIMMQGDTIDQAAIPDASVTPSKIAGSGDFAFPADVRLKDADGSHYVGFQAPTTVSTNKVWTLPAADGSASQYLQTNGSGVLSWATISIGGGTGIDFNDNIKARWGTGNDLEVFHNGSNSIINDAGTGDLLLQVGGSTKATVSSTGLGVTGALTVSTNATITGNLTVNGTTTTVDSVTLSVKDKNIEMGVVSSPSDTTADGGGITLKGASDKTFNWVDSTDAWTSSEHIHLGDNKKLIVGTGQDLSLYHDGTNSYIDNREGNLVLMANTTDVGIKIIPDASCELYENNVKKAETTTTGFNVIGSLLVNGSALATGNTVDLVADGAIAAGKPVIIKTNGKVEQVKQTPNELSSPLNSSSSNTQYGTIRYRNGSVDNPVSVHGRKNNQMLVFYGDNNDSGKQKGALVRPGESSFDVTGVMLVNVNNAYWKNKGIAYDVTNEHYAVIGRDTGDGNKPKFVFMDSNNTSHLSASSVVTLSSNSCHSGMDNRIVYCGSGKFAVLTYDYSSSERLCSFLLTWNGSSYTVSSQINVDSGTYGKNAAMCYHADSGKLIAIWRAEQSSSAVVYSVGTIGSNTITWSSRANVEAADKGRHLEIITDDSTNKIVAVGREDNGNSGLWCWHGSISGTTVTWSASTNFQQSSVSTYDNFAFRLAYHDVLGKVFLTWATSNRNTNYARMGSTSTGSTTITWGNNHTLNVNMNNSDLMPAPVYGDSLGRVQFGYRNENSGNHGWYRWGTYVEQVNNANASNVIGFAEDAINDTATGTIKLTGNVVGNQSSLTPGTAYYVQGNGTLGTSQDNTIGAASGKSKAGVAISSTTLKIADYA